jgi:hypothetical protein
MAIRSVVVSAAALVLAATLTGCSVNIGGGSTASPSAGESAFCAGWTQAQQAVNDVGQAVDGGNPLQLPQALESLGSSVTQMSQSLPTDAPAEVQQTLDGIGTTVSEAVSQVLTGEQNVEGVVNEIQADLRRVGRYATSIC